MDTVASRWIALTPYFLSLLRIVAAFVFIQYGTAKLLAWPGATCPGGWHRALLTQAGIAGLLETVGGSLLLVGFVHAPGGVHPLRRDGVSAYFIGHAGRGFWPVLNQGAPAVIFLLPLALHLGGWRPAPGASTPAWKRR
jgi:putative oxidoreductase